MPDLYVFPGGRVDRADALCATTAELRPEVASRVPGGPDRARSLAVAAVRETFEETGLLIGADDGDGDGIRPHLAGLDYVGRAITPASSAIRYHARFFVSDAARASGELGGSGELLDLRWCTFADAMELPIMDVTRLMLREVERRVARAAPPRRPFVRYRGEHAMIRYE